MAKFEIKCRFTEKVLFECEADSLRLAVEKAVSVSTDLRGANLSRADLFGADLSRADLRDADLRDADLRGANLFGADLRGADLRGADLRGANLRGADLRDADLSRADLRRAELSGANLFGADLFGADLFGADLSRADLSRADLRDADLRDAELIGANLSRADLRGAELSGANLFGANLSDTKRDFIRVISAMKNEVAGLYKALLGGKIDGSQYEGECSCLKGTLANTSGCGLDGLSKFGLEKNSSEPSEKWFMAIRPGDTPENNPVSAITVAWIKEFAKENGIQLPTRKVVWE